MSEVSPIAYENCLDIKLWALSEARIVGQCVGVEVEQALTNGIVEIQG